MKLKKKVVIPLFIVLLLATAWMALFKPRLLPKPIQRHLFADWMIQEERRTDPAVGHLGGFRSPSPGPMPISWSTTGIRALPNRGKDRDLSARLSPVSEALDLRCITRIWKWHL